MLSNSTPYIDEEPCCPTPTVIQTPLGSWVCSSCGTDFGFDFVQSRARRSYTTEEEASRIHDSPVISMPGPRTVFDSFNPQLGAEKSRRFARLAKINNSNIGTLERNCWEASYCQAFARSHFAFPPFVEGLASKMYYRAAQKHLMMGRSIESFVLASFYLAARFHRLPVLLSDFTEFVGRRRFLQSIKLLQMEVLPAMEIRVPRPATEAILQRFGQEMGFPPLVLDAASKCLALYHKRFIHFADPRGLVAGTLYFTGKGAGLRVRQNQIAAVLGVTEVTLRKYTHQFDAMLLPFMGALCMQVHRDCPKQIQGWQMPAALLRPISG